MKINIFIIFVRFLEIVLLKIQKKHEKKIGIFVSLINNCPMKKIICLLLLFPVWVSAQNSQIVEAYMDEDLSEKVSIHIQYLFPEFSDGEVYFKDAPKGGGALNYNMLVGEMQFMHNDAVMTLANVRDVSMVTINNRHFYPFNNSEFAEELWTTDKVRLRVRRKGSAVNYAQKGAFGTSSSTSSITTYNSIGTDGRQFDLSIKADVLVSLKYFYYLVGSNGKYTQIKNVKTFTKQFPAHRTQIEAFVKEHNIRFDRENDLKALLAYCSGL